MDASLFALFLAVALCGPPDAAGAETRRLLQTGTSREVSAAISASRNATQAARSLIADFQAGSSPDLAAVAGYLDGQPYTPYILGHIAGHAAENASESGQVSATLASAGAVAAAGLSAVAALNGSEAYTQDAQDVLASAEHLTSQVREEDNTTISTATKASAVLLARVAHDSSVILYWPADGGSGNASIFNETVVFANGLLEEGSTQVIVDFTQAQLDEGANPALGLAMVHVILHELLGAIYTYRGHLSAVVSEQYAASITVDQPFLPQTANVLAEALAAAADPTAQSIDGLLDMLYALDGNIICQDEQEESILGSIQAAA